MTGPASLHKPCRKIRKDDNGVSNAARPISPLASFFWPARGAVSQWEVIPLILITGGLFRWAAGLWGYSGG